MNLAITIKDIQHINKLNFSIDLSKNQLLCIVGKNGAGKTTLIRALKNLYSADTFTKTASPYIFKDSSHIKYVIDNEEYIFTYNRKIGVIDSKSIIKEDIKKSISVELPIPNGIRFNHFQKLSNIDEELRKSISLTNYSTPDELILFLSNVYNSDRFRNLREITIKKEKYYFILKENNFYIREDYLSSGEYFVIHLYKLIQKKCKLIAIDEIDISLDASAQTNLLRELRIYCNNFGTNIVFTTHSLALMKTLEEKELHYMEEENKEINIKNVSYNHVKSMLFGFKGWDKYILTEDKMLESYLNHLITKEESSFFYKFKIIYIAGASNVVSLIKRNDDEHFFSTTDNVIAILDGDEKNKKYCKNNGKVFFIPFDSIEKQLEIHYRNNEFPFTVTITGNPENFSKNLYAEIIRSKKMTDSQIFTHLNNNKIEEVETFKKMLLDYLNI